MWSDIATALSDTNWCQRQPATLAVLEDWFESLRCIDSDAALALSAVARGPAAFWRAAAASQFVRDSALHESDCVAKIVAAESSDDLLPSAETVAVFIETHGVERGLRRLRRRLMLEIAWRDIAGCLPLDRVLHTLSEFADLALDIALGEARKRMRERYGELRDTAGDSIPLQVLCMGKLGGNELNFSSDIDIIFVFPADGQSDGKRSVEAAEYCLREARVVIDILDRQNDLGRVFRVDTRLRPFGSAGALAISTDALEVYLQRHGRDWERYAFVKARLPRAQANSVTAHWMRECLRPFVYRAYLDFSVLGALRDMQRTIEREAASGDAAADLKRGPGGIREIEFIVQSWQLIRGGKAQALQTQSLYEALEAAEALSCLSSETTRALRTAYDFLRVLENRLQQLADRQTHRLPETPDERDALVLAMAAKDWDGLMAQLDHHREFVSRVFRGLVFAGTPSDDAAATPDWLEAKYDELLAWFGERDLPEPQALAELIVEFAKRIRQQPLTGEVRERVSAVVQAVVSRLGGFSEPSIVLRRSLRLVDAVSRRSAYLVLLTEQPAAVDRLMRLLDSGRFIADQIVEQPMLLDELLDSRLFTEPPDITTLREELDALGFGEALDDTEALTSILTRFVRATQFHIAVADVGGLLPIMRVSDRLSDTATVVLEKTLAMAWHEMVSKHGAPDGTTLVAPGFAIVAYGKLGGLELGYGSDLDIVFLHNLDPGETPGPSSIDHAVFVMRLARRIVHLLSVQTGHGRLYEVDMRLRPSGRSGLLVSSLSAFARYQQHDAWTWEHQALVRARAVAGDSEVMKSFADVRHQTLVASVDRASLRVSVADMRRRMRENLSRSGPNEFDLKQDPGGIADLEFLVQYLVLAHADSHPSLLRWPDNIRQLDSLAEYGVLTAEVVANLQQAYVELRAVAHRLALDDRRPLVPSNTLQDVRRLVSHQWQRWLGAH